VVAGADAGEEEVRESSRIAEHPGQSDSGLVSGTDERVEDAPAPKFNYKNLIPRKSKPDSQSIREEEFFDWAKYSLDPSLPDEDFDRQLGRFQQSLDLKDRLDTKREREKYGFRLFALVVAWLFLTLATVWAAAVSRAEFEVSDTVLGVLLGSSSVNVIGLLVIFVKYLFPQPGPRD
jgi:hypothetical protein